jgi:hypothetical protein
MFTDSRRRRLLSRAAVCAGLAVVAMGFADGVATAGPPQPVPADNPFVPLVPNPVPGIVDTSSYLNTPGTLLSDAGTLLTDAGNLLTTPPDASPPALAPDPNALPDPNAVPLDPNALPPGS